MIHTRWNESDDGRNNFIFRSLHQSTKFVLVYNKFDRMSTSKRNAYHSLEIFFFSCLHTRWSNSDCIFMPNFVIIHFQQHPNRQTSSFALKIRKINKFSLFSSGTWHHPQWPPNVHFSTFSRQNFLSFLFNSPFSSSCLFWFFFLAEDDDGERKFSSFQCFAFAKLFAFSPFFTICLREFSYFSLFIAMLFLLFRQLNCQLTFSLLTKLWGTFSLFSRSISTRTWICSPTCVPCASKDVVIWVESFLAEANEALLLLLILMLSNRNNCSEQSEHSNWF